MEDKNLHCSMVKHQTLLHRLKIDENSCRPHYVFFCFRYIIVKFSHYGIGLSHSFSRGGNRIQKISYFVLLFSLISTSLIPYMIKTFSAQFPDAFVKARLCVLQRYTLLSFHQKVSTLSLFVY